MFGFSLLLDWYTYSYDALVVVWTHFTRALSKTFSKIFSEKVKFCMKAFCGWVLDLWPNVHPFVRPKYHIESSQKFTRHARPKFPLNLAKSFAYRAWPKLPILLLKCYPMPPRKGLRWHTSDQTISRRYQTRVAALAETKQSWDWKTLVVLHSVKCNFLKIIQEVQWR